MWIHFRDKCVYGYLFYNTLVYVISNLCFVGRIALQLTVNFFTNLLTSFD